MGTEYGDALGFQYEGMTAFHALTRSLTARVAARVYIARAFFGERRGGLRPFRAVAAVGDGLTVVSQPLADPFIRRNDCCE